jgi:single-strand DNA-binding protein
MKGENNMNNLNSILIEGELSENPEYKETNKGTPVCTFIIKTKRFYKKDSQFEEENNYFEIEVWGKLAELCNNNLIKGSGVRVVGRLKQYFEDFDGKEISKVKVIGEHVEFKPSFKSIIDKKDEEE